MGPQQPLDRPAHGSGGGRGRFVFFKNINVEAYPDPAPAIVEVVAQWTGASAEEMERLVTIPLEVSVAGMPGLKATYSKSLFGLTHLRCMFNYGFPYKDARQEVINRLSNLTVPVPAGVSPVISPASPIGEIYRYTLKTPKNALGQEIYTLNDIKALEDYLHRTAFPAGAANHGHLQLRRHRSNAMKFNPIPSGSSVSASRWPNCKPPWPTATPTSAAISWSRAAPRRWSAASASSAAARIPWKRPSA